MARPTLQQRFSKICQWSLAWHLLFIATALFVGTFNSAPKIPEVIEIDMLEDVPIPKGNSDEVGLGTYKEEPQQAAADQTPPPVATPPQTPPTPIETPPPVKEPPAPVKAETPPPARDTMAEPTKAPVKTPTKVPDKAPAKTNTAKTPTNAPTNKSPTTAPVAKVPAQQAGLLGTINSIKPVSGRPGDTNSEGWKLGNTTEPIKEIPVGAVMNQYTAQVKARIRGRWAVPAAINALPPKMRPTVTIRVMVSPSGGVTGVTLTSPSGNGLLDESVMRAARNGALPPIPEAIRDKVASGLTLTFKP